MTELAVPWRYIPDTKWTCRRYWAWRQPTNFACSFSQNGSRIAPIPSSSHSQFLVGWRTRHLKRSLTSREHIGEPAMDSQCGLHSLAYLHPKGVDKRQMASHKSTGLAVAVDGGESAFG